jgi:SAM-dependent methyltransferase
MSPHWRMRSIRLTLSWLRKRLTHWHRSRRALLNHLDGYRNVGLLYVAAELGLADLLADGPRSSAELAQTLGAHAPSLHRVLRGLVLAGVCSEERDGRFGLTPLGKWLQADRSGSLRGSVLLTGKEYVGAWGGLLHSAMTGEAAFDHVFGMSVWEHRRQHPELNEYFNAGMNRGADGAADLILAAYDFSSFRTIADVGGGQGALLAAILKAHPSATGILFDLPHVVAGASSCLQTAGVAERCRIAGGSFFDHIPDGADAHLLKNVVHDWDDERAIALFRNCHRALEPGGVLLLVERVMPARVKRNSDVILTDIHMLALGGGRERSVEEYRALFAAAGFRLTKVISTKSWFCIIEGKREAER